MSSYDYEEETPDREIRERLEALRDDFPLGRPCPPYEDPPVFERWGGYWTKWYESLRAYVDVTGHFIVYNELGKVGVADSIDEAVEIVRSWRDEEPGPRER